jgi:hypothetical protein
MRRVVVVGAVVIGVLLVAAAITVLALSSRPPGGKFTDPASARCDTPRAEFGPMRSGVGHREADVHFTCAGVTIAGTLDEPTGRGPFPAVVWVHGAGESTRFTYGGTPLVQALVRAGVAVLSYDKRGVGESQGECCPGDYGQFNRARLDGARPGFARPRSLTLFS